MTATSGSGWLLHEQQPVEQLDRVVLVEEAVIDQSLVLVAGPGMQGRGFGLLHGTKLAAGYGHVHGFEARRLFRRSSSTLSFSAPSRTVSDPCLRKGVGARR